MADPVRLEKAGEWTHPETGEKVEIPAGSVVHRVGDTVQTMVGPLVLVSDTEPKGTVLYWQNPPETPEGELHGDQVEGYEPHFDRGGQARRVLQHLTDEPHLDRGPRNTAERLVQELVEDPHSFTGRAFGIADVQEQLDRLGKAGLVKQRADGTYGVTKAGLTELRN